MTRPTLFPTNRISREPYICWRCLTRSNQYPLKSRKIRVQRYNTENSPRSKPVMPLRKQLKEEARARKTSNQNIQDTPTETTSTGAPPWNSVTQAIKLLEWELTVGIEIHAELNTSKKLFSPARTSTVDTPNTHVSVFDAALPGTQPQFQKEALLPALRAALALGCDIQPRSGWDRKHYFWWDQPNGYQITQYYEPFAKNGLLTLYPRDGISEVDHPSTTVGIKQIQLEQDTAKTVLQPPSTHLLDFNRVSHPLIEIISLPQIHTPETATAFVRKVQSILQSVSANTTGMELGGLRADVNVSVHRRPNKYENLSISEPQSTFSYAGVEGLGQRTEIKNLNTLKSIQDAIIAERDRQIHLIETGGAVRSETRGWNLGSTTTHLIRSKEGEVDYRYMPDPDLPPLLIGQDLVQHLRETLPRLPDETLELLIQDERYKLTIKDAQTLLSLDNGDRLDFYFQVVSRTLSELNELANIDEYQQKVPRKKTQDSSTATDKIPSNLEEIPYPQTSAQQKAGKTAANWVLHELGSLLTKSSLPLSENIATPTQLSTILVLLLTDQITLPTAKNLLTLTFNGDDQITPSKDEQGNILKWHQDPTLTEQGPTTQLARQTRAYNEISGIESYIGKNGLRLKPMTDAEYQSLASRILLENPKIADDARKEEGVGYKKQEHDFSAHLEKLEDSNANDRDNSQAIDKQETYENEGKSIKNGKGKKRVKDKKNSKSKEKKGKIMWFVGQMIRRGEEGRVQPERAERALRVALAGGGDDGGG